MPIKYSLNIHKPEVSKLQTSKMLMDTNCEEGYYYFNTSIIIECFMLVINHNSNQFHFKNNLDSHYDLERFSILVNFTTDYFSTSYKLRVKK